MNYAEFLNYTRLHGPTWKGGVSFNKWFRAFILWKKASIAAYLSSFPIGIPLLTTVVPSNGNLTPSFVRATVAEQKDFEGRRYTALAGEARFKHVRREYNLWGIQSTSLASGANNSMTLPAGAYQFSMGAGTGTATFSGTGGATGTLAATVLGRTFVAKTISAGTLVVTASVADLADLQVVSMIGCSDQTTIREYVSVGALVRNTQDPLYLSLPGTAGNFAGTPDSAAASVTGDIDMDVDIVLTSLTSAAYAPLLAKEGAAAGNYAYYFAKDAGNSGKLYAEISVDGTALISYLSSVTMASAGIIAGARYRLRFSRIAATGVSKFWWSADNGATWTQLGADVAGTSGNIFDGNAALNVGANVAAGAGVAGSYYSAQVWAGIRTAGGVLKADFNPMRDALTPTGTITSSTTGEVWTLNGASSVIRNISYHGSCVDGVKCFATDYSGNPLPTSDSATYPMLRYHPEPLAINKCLQSNGLGTAPWTDSGTPDATQNVTGPNGQANYAWTLTDNNAAGHEFKQQPSIVFSAGTTGCLSVLVGKKVSSPAYPMLHGYADVAGTKISYIIINEVAGTVTPSTTGGSYLAPVAYGISSYNDNFWLVWVAYTQAGANATTIAQLFPAGSTDGTTLSAAATGSSVFCDAQFEAGTSPTSRIATTTVAVQRDADILTYTGADIANIKTLHVDSFRREVGVSAVGGIVTISDGTANNSANLYMNTATEAKFLVATAASNVVLQAASNAYTPGAQNKISMSFTTNDTKMDFNGTAQTPDTSCAMAALNKIYVGADAVGGNILNGTVGGIYADTKTHSQSELGAIDR